MSKRMMMVFASALMMGAGVSAQEGDAQTSVHVQAGTQRPTKASGLRTGGAPGQGKAMARPGTEANPAERGAMGMNMGRNQMEGMSMFLEADANKDGVIDEAEAKAAEAKFIALFHQRIKDHNAQIIQRFDKNGDGVLDDQEKAVMKEAMEKLSTTLRTKTENFNEVYRRLDKDGSGQISPEEFQGFMAELQKQALPVLFKEFDKNGDGKLEGDELPAAQAAMMKKYNLNHDDQLSLLELRPLWRDATEHGKALRTEQTRKNVEDQMKKRFDLNGDGMLDEQEKARAADELRKIRGKGVMAPPQPE